MKKIEAIIKPFKLEAVKDALVAAGTQGMTIHEVKGFGSQKGFKEHFRGTEYRVDFLPKVLITVYAEDDKYKNVISVIEEQAHTGNIGDGKIVVTTIDEIIRIRTGETGPAAIHDDDDDHSAA